MQYKKSPYFHHAFEELFEKLFCERSTSVFESLIIHDKTLDSVFYDYLSCPFTRLHCLFIFYLESYGNNDLEIIVSCILFFLCHFPCKNLTFFYTFHNLYFAIHSWITSHLFSHPSDPSSPSSSSVSSLRSSLVRSSPA